MAEVQQQEGNHKKRGGIRSKKLSTRIDLTPMVDLGFLLITFFIFTTTLSEAKSMKLNMPSDEPTTDPPQVGKNKVITIIPSGDNKVYYYFGEDPKSMAVTNYGADGMRKIIINKKKEVAAKYGDAQQTVVLIKPTDQSSYQNLVDVLDEMLINNVSRYMLLDVDAIEKQLAINK